MDANLTGSDRPQRIELLAVSPNYFSLLGASAQLGRVFGPQDHAQGFAEGVVISDGMWRRSFAADPNVLGRKIYVDTDLYTVIGVMPAGFVTRAKHCATKSTHGARRVLPRILFPRRQCELSECYPGQSVA